LLLLLRLLQSGKSRLPGVRLRRGRRRQISDRLLITHCDSTGSTTGAVVALGEREGPHDHGGVSSRHVRVLPAELSEEAMMLVQVVAAVVLLLRPRLLLLLLLLLVAIRRVALVSGRCTLNGGCDFPVVAAERIRGGVRVTIRRVMLFMAWMWLRDMCRLAVLLMPIVRLLVGETVVPGHRGGTRRGRRLLRVPRAVRIRILAAVGALQLLEFVVANNGAHLHRRGPHDRSGNMRAAQGRAQHPARDAGSVTAERGVIPLRRLLLLLLLLLGMIRHWAHS
jgi:hypothetical protein